MKLIYKILVNVVCMTISMQFFCMDLDIQIDKSEAQRYIDDCDKIDNECEKKLKELCTNSCKIDFDIGIKFACLEADNIKKSLINSHIGQFSRIEQRYDISDNAWSSCARLANARTRASRLSVNDSSLSLLQLKEKYNFICKGKIDAAFVEILQCVFLRESFNPAKFRLCASKDVPCEVKTVCIACITDEHGCTRYQETGYGLIVINPFLINRLSPVLQEAFSLFLLSCVGHNNCDYLSDIEIINNITIKNKDVIDSSIHQASLLFVALHNQEVAMLLKELFRNRNMFFDKCDDAVRYYKKMCEIDTFHKYVGWLNECSDKSSEKQKVVQYKQVEKK